MSKFLALLILLGAPALAGGELRLGTTTSVENSGLMARLLPAFEQRCGCAVRVIPVGSGKALELGRRGDIDALITHAPADERQFVADGHGSERREVMHNHFVLLGPPANPAAVAKEDGIIRAMLKIAEARAPFVSRGDDSGTHKMEMSLWQQSGGGGEFSPSWYLSAGAGMGRALLIADELGGYVLSDYGTYLSFLDKTELRVLSEDEPALVNSYSILLVNPARHPHVNVALARQFADWLTSAPTRRQIGDYRIHGKPLFTPAAD